MEISISILTFNRPEILRSNLTGLETTIIGDCEVIVVDNSTNDETQTMVTAEFPQVKYIHNAVNLGVAGRNRGISEAQGDVVITLDDDVTDLSLEDIELIHTRFKQEEALGALCFRVLHFETGAICNWCHPPPAEKAGLSKFVTYEISEGAVAFRKSALADTKMYFEKFFISHEGKDLAFRIMNKGYRVEYDGRISVKHCHAVSGRSNWRRYYYDTRNALWIAWRNMPLLYGMRFLTRSLFAMLAYSIRDGYTKYWLKAIIDGTRDFSAIWSTREVWTPETRSLCREVDKTKAGFFYMVRKRLFRRGVQI